jgi:hypothetical protein
MALQVSRSSYDGPHCRFLLKVRVSVSSPDIQSTHVHRTLPFPFASDTSNQQLLIQLNQCTRYPLLLAGHSQCGFNACPRLASIQDWWAGIEPQIAPARVWYATTEPRTPKTRQIRPLKKVLIHWPHIRPSTPPFRAWASLLPLRTMLARKTYTAAINESPPVVRLIPATS